MEMPIIVAGHSHVNIFGVPLAFPDKNNILVDAKHMPEKIKVLTGEWPRSRRYWKDLARTANGQNVALFWKGNQHLSKFLFESEEPFDFLVSDRNFPINLGSTIISQAAIREILAKDFAELDAIGQRLNAAGCQLFLCAPPPPKGDDAYVRSVLAKELHFVNFAASRGKSLGDIPLTQRIIRLKLWHVLCNLLKESAEKNTMRFVASPSATHDDEGFLKRDFYASDATHANSEYGRVMALHLAEAIRN